MEYIISLPKHKGKTIEQVALMDYPYLVWVYENLDRLSRQFRDHIHRTIQLLNNFVPKIRCMGEEGCDNTAEYLSIALTHNPYTSPKIDISVSTRFVCCNNENCESKMLTYEKARLYPIKFDSLLQFPAFPRYIREDIRKVLLEAIGFNGRITRNDSHEFFERLETRVRQPQQLSIFS